MAKTITLTGVKIDNININQNFDKDGKLKVIASAINYFAHDEAGKIIKTGASQKYTSISPFAEDEKMTSDAEKLILDFVSEMEKLMVKREDL